MLKNIPIGVVSYNIWQFEGGATLGTTPNTPRDISAPKTTEVRIVITPSILAQMGQVRSISASTQRVGAVT